LKSDSIGYQVFVLALSDTCVLRLKHLCLTCKTLVSVGLNTCVCQDKGLQLSGQGEGGRSERLFSFPPDHRKPVHSGNIRPIGCSSSSLAKGTAYPGLGLNQTDSEGLLKEAENEKTLLSFIREIALIFYQGGG
ncbi:hypothetical protein ACMYZ5_08675, partial [Bacteroides sp. KG68]|uniref:hypothetical protein n=1 Tax=Bacteroides sp. KG68 TaxID=3397824 RepID=UPI003D965265